MLNKVAANINSFTVCKTINNLFIPRTQPATAFIHTHTLIIIFGKLTCALFLAKRWCNSGLSQQDMRICSHTM